MTEKRHPDETDEIIPMMDDYEVECIEYFISYVEGSVNVLEWGSGDSTIYFTNEHEDEINRWDAIEDHTDWHEHVRTHTPDFTNTKYVTADEYYSEPLKADIDYDIILVDGKFRLACMVASKSIINDDGLVLLHDSARGCYDSVWKLYDNHEVLSGGKVQSNDYMETPYEGLTVFWDDNQ